MIELALHSPATVADVMEMLHNTLKITIGQNAKGELMTECKWRSPLL